jgi:hypothetical protein
MGIRHGGVGRSAGLELRVMCSWQAVTRGSRAEPALVPWISSAGIAAGRRHRLILDPSARCRGPGAGLVVVIARPSRADGADVARGGGVGVNITVWAQGTRMLSGLSLLVED